jgi:hypothetical protein
MSLPSSCHKLVPISKPKTVTQQKTDIIIVTAMKISKSHILEFQLSCIMLALLKSTVLVRKETSQLPVIVMAPVMCLRLVRISFCLVAVKGAETHFLGTSCDVDVNSQGRIKKQVT